MTLRELLDAATPGEWEYDLVNGYVGPTYPTNDRREFRYIVADVDTTGEAVALDQGHANACLIALAPELAALVLDMAVALRMFRAHSPLIACDKPTCGDELCPTHVDALLARLDRISTQTERGTTGPPPAGTGIQDGLVARRPTQTSAPRSVCVCDPGDCGEDCGTA